MPRVTITGELTQVSNNPKYAQVYFELRDGRGGVKGTMWRRDFERSGLPEGSFTAGAEVVVTGGPDYYEGGKTASPAFSFRATDIRLSGEGDLLARLEALRKKFAEEGLLDRQKRLSRPVLPRRIGVITAEGGAARQDLMAGLRRRGWAGELVWGFAPVQDRKAAPTITRALGDMAAFGEVEVIVVCRGGGSLTDLWAFCDEDLCRTVALLAVPVVSAVGHERDVTLLDDVAAVRCSTPTHAADAVVGLDCGAERQALRRRADRIAAAGPAAIRGRIRPLAVLASGPGRAVRQQRGVLNQRVREIAASARRGLAGREDGMSRIGRSHLLPAAARVARLAAAGQAANVAMPARVTAACSRALATRERALEVNRIALRAHDPQRTLERGYARIEDRAGSPVVDPEGARRAVNLRIVFAGGPVDATVGRRASRRRAAGVDGENEFEQIGLEGIGSDE